MSLQIWWESFNADDVFSYQTDKLVNIKDKRLGITRLLLNLIIWAYIIGFAVIYKKGYLLTEVPTGLLYTSLKRPVESIDLKTLNYCMQNSNSSAKTVLPCQIDDEFDVNLPPDETEAMFVATRIESIEQVASCTNKTICKTPWNTLKDFVYFSAAVESFTIMSNI